MLNNGLLAGKSLKKSVIDDPREKVISEAKSETFTAKNEVMAVIEDNERVNAREHKDIKTMLDNDSQSLKAIRRDIEDLVGSFKEQQKIVEDHASRIEAREESEKVILLSLKALLNERLSVGETHDLIDASTNIDTFLINERK